ncbi:hypothetical protein HPB49_020741 [Dermacentor silvarum]|uniref:Uncharacterized protein n=1 Tax=Dermacentor silvarum TaxID=543639 RepID=A0ACB8C5D5_DERSI|nr:hypothetical protein HPB49_020741 [Dermacentor silvarum]
MGSPHGSRACRRLFDDGEDRGTRRTLDKMQEDSSRAWNYDFGRDRPMQGRFQWQRGSDDDKRTQRRWGSDASPGSGERDAPRVRHVRSAPRRLLGAQSVA